MSLLLLWAFSAAGAEPTTAPADPLAASRITLHLQNAAPKAVLDELTRQARTELRTVPPNLWETQAWPTLDVDLDDASFWTAIKHVCTRTGLSLQRSGFEPDLVLVHGAMRPIWEYPGIEQGPFLIVVQNIRRNDVLDLVDPRNDRHTCAIRFSLYAEPRLRVLKASSSAVIEQAADNHGQPLQPETPPRGQGEGMQASSTGAWSFAASFKLPVEPGHTIATLRGHVPLVVQSEAEIVEVKDILAVRNVTQSVRGRQLTVRSVQRNGEVYTVHLAFRRAAADPREWLDINLANTIRLLDAKGRPLSRRSAGSAQPGEEFEMKLLFGREDWAGDSGAGVPARLVWEMPTATRQVNVPFVLTDLRLP